MIAAIEKQKFVYVMERKEETLIIYSPRLSSNLALLQLRCFYQLTFEVCVVVAGQPLIVLRS